MVSCELINTKVGGCLQCSSLYCSIFVYIWNFYNKIKNKKSTTSGEYPDLNSNQLFPRCVIRRLLKFSAFSFFILEGEYDYEYHRFVWEYLINPHKAHRVLPVFCSLYTQFIAPDFCKVVHRMSSVNFICPCLHSHTTAIINKYPHFCPCAWESKS